MKKLIPIALIFCLATQFTALRAFTSHHEDPPEGRGKSIPLQQTASGRQMIKVDSFLLRIVPPSSGVQFYGDGIIFLSQSKDEARMLPEHVSFGTLQAYYGVLNDSSINDQRLFIPSAPFPYPAEAITFNHDYTLMLYTMRARNDAAEKIWMAMYKGGADVRDRWTFDNRPLDFCTENSTYTHPALSADGNLLIFSSNMSGTIGEMDLFMTRREGDGWREPVNMGRYINTAGNELFPFLDNDNNLWFSSDGRGGIGGYDIFMCRFDGKAWAYPVNLTQAINTPDDDIAFTINRSDGRSAFYTTRETSRRRNMQLYRVSLDPGYLTADLKNLTDAFSAIAVPDRVMEKNITELMPQKVPLIAAKEEPQPEQKVTAVKKEETKTDEKAAETKAPATAKQASDGLLFRVQFSASTKPVGPFQVTVDGKNYTTYEYLHAGAYRSCAGEFNTIAEAVPLQSAMRKAGFEQAFVVAFRNGERVVNFR